jgi:perosamine synthetase
MSATELFQDQIPLLRPWTDEEEVQAAAEVIRSGWLSQGPKVIEFEKTVASYVGAEYGVATNSCTTSLHLALHLSGVGSDDDVVMPSFTCMATANAVHHAGAQPVFADIDPRTYNLDPASVELLLTPRTKAIIVVHQIGLAADMEPFVKIAGKHGLALIEDGACSLGASSRGERVGGIAAPTCFSFHPRKMITTGEGGMITTNNAELAEEARILRATGASISDLERHKAKGVLVQHYDAAGYNYRMTDLQAAIGIVQMKKLPLMLEQRTAQARFYDQAFAALDEIILPWVPPTSAHAYSSYMIRFRPESRIDRDVVLRKMAERGVSCRIGIQPLHHEPFYQERYTGVRFPVTEEAAQSTLFLPIFPGLSEDDQTRVVAELKDAIRGSR